MLWQAAWSAYTLPKTNTSHVPDVWRYSWNSLINHPLVFGSQKKLYAWIVYHPDTTFWNIYFRKTTLDIDHSFLPNKNWCLHPGRLTWNLRMHPWKRKIIFQTIIFRFYVNLPGCICFLAFFHVFFVVKFSLPCPAKDLPQFYGFIASVLWRSQVTMEKARLYRPIFGPMNCSGRP